MLVGLELGSKDCSYSKDPPLHTLDFSLRQGVTKSRSTAWHSILLLLVILFCALGAEGFPCSHSDRRLLRLIQNLPILWVRRPLGVTLSLDLDIDFPFISVSVIISDHPDLIWDD